MKPYGTLFRAFLIFLGKMLLSTFLKEKVFITLTTRWKLFPAKLNFCWNISILEISWETFCLPSCHVLWFADFASPCLVSGFLLSLSVSLTMPLSLSILSLSFLYPLLYKPQILILLASIYHSKSLFFLLFLCIYMLLLVSVISHKNVHLWFS